MTVTLTILGSGSSAGVPRPALGWGACDPANPKNRRRRCSLLAEKGGAGGLTQCVQGDGIAVGKAGLLARLGTNAYTLVEVKAAFFDDTVFQRPGFGNLALEIQVCRVDTGARQLAEHRLQAVEGQSARGQELLTDGG